MNADDHKAYVEFDFEQLPAFDFEVRDTHFDDDAELLCLKEALLGEAAEAEWERHCEFLAGLPVEG